MFYLFDLTDDLPTEPTYFAYKANQHEIKQYIVSLHLKRIPHTIHWDTGRDHNVRLTLLFVQYISYSVTLCILPLPKPHFFAKKIATFFFHEYINFECLLILFGRLQIK